MRNLIILLLIAIFTGCGISQQDHEQVLSENNLLVTENIKLKNEVDSLLSGDKNYIEIPFSDLIMLFKNDSITFDEKVRSLGYDGNGILYGKSGEFWDHLISSKGIGVGHYYFHNLPSIVRIYDANWLVYTFPISQLSYYKAAILEKKNFTSLDEEKTAYIDKYKANNVTEVYVDKFNKLEYNISYYKDYASIKISNRSY